MNTERLDHDFNYHAPDAVKVAAHESVRNALGGVAHQLNEIIPGDSREKSLAITKLEEAMFWANAALARNPRPENSR